MPNGKRVRWKDLRSGMACHLLSAGWQPHEISQRLGHTPNADTLNAYINHLAVDRRRLKKRFHDSEVETLRKALRRSKEREKLMPARLSAEPQGSRSLGEENRALRSSLERTKARLEEVVKMVEGIIGCTKNRPQP